MSEFIAFSLEPSQAPLLGGKARALAQLHEAGFSVPEWFVVLPASFEASANGAATLPALPCARVIREIEAALGNAIPEAATFAVRSSALDEDGSEHSFAGQFESYLLVPATEVAAKVAAVWRSAFSERVLAYRRERGLSSARTGAPAVLIQRMINAGSAGVAFGADPVTGRRDMTVIAAVRGLGDKLVSGEENADTYHIDSTGKLVSLSQSNGAETPVLTTPQAQEIRELARRANRYFGIPQDIEWAREDDKLFLLQSRPITSLRNMVDPSGAFNLWDNSNIAESYSGITTPLTFSFARGIYEEVYRQFCKLMGVPTSRIADNRDTFQRMLGLINGRVYYNLLNWYRVLALLPGYKINSQFMEQMMGVKEGLPEGALPIKLPSTPAEKLKDALDIGRTVIGLISNHLRLPANIKRFHARLNDSLKEPSPALEEMRPDQLAGAYRDLEKQLLTRWDAPLVNDFLAMIFYGVSKRLAQKWCGDANGSLQNDLLCAGGEMISAEPARRVREMAEVAALSPELANLLGRGSLREINAKLVQHARFNALYNAYIEKFGDRCLEELKLESKTLHDDPLSLFRAVGHLAARKPAEHIPADNHRGQTEARVKEALRGNPLKGTFFFWILKHARARVRDRENLRFERTRLFGRVRRIFLELGKRYLELGVLDHPSDIFNLTVEEALGFVEGTTVGKNLRGLAALRQAEFDGHRNGTAPSERFVTRGTVNSGNTYLSEKKDSSSLIATEQLQGIGCCPGIVRGIVRVILEPRGAEIKPGEILVAQRTDPGWIMLFPSAAGLLVEFGSLLSHSAIVARELGIPAVVSISNLTLILQDGDMVELDGSTGLVRRIPHE
ncbi:MAG: phosphoenolpyruvate synthase [Chthoniobacteraceae bacterium]|nr:phosphoenolpyruvate synthase [Chthoniobacteraceae bacterium]